MSDGTSMPDCPGCERTLRVRLRDDEVERLLADYLRANPSLSRADEATVASRLATCQACPDLKYAGTTCRHCGCLVAARARVAEKSCPAVPAKWSAVVNSEVMS